VERAERGGRDLVRQRLEQPGIEGQAAVDLALDSTSLAKEKRLRSYGSDLSSPHRGQLALRHHDQLIAQCRGGGIADRALDGATIASGATTTAEGLRKAGHCGAPH
jgi:hypothetical protein